VTPRGEFIPSSEVADYRLFSLFPFRASDDLTGCLAGLLELPHHGILPPRAPRAGHAPPPSLVNSHPSAKGGAPTGEELLGRVPAMVSSRQKEPSMGHRRRGCAVPCYGERANTLAQI